MYSQCGVINTFALNFERKFCVFIVSSLFRKICLNVQLIVRRSVCLVGFPALFGA